VWFNAALLEAPGVHACAVHSGVASSVAPSAHGHASATMVMQGHGAHEAPAPSSDNACACTCLGTCCGVSPFVSSAPPISIAAHYASIAARRIGQRVVAPSVDRPHARPFANGPPSLA